jgi:hypothetical protein
MLLAEPYEYLDLHAGQRVVLRVDSYQDGTAIIHPRTITPRHVRIMMDQRQLTAPPAAGEPIANEVPVLRLFGARLDEASPASYWDTSSKTLRADLLARFQNGLNLPAIITLTANGHAPHKRYSVSVG